MIDLTNAVVVFEDGQTWNTLVGSADIVFLDADSSKLSATSPQGNRSLIDWMADGDHDPSECSKPDNILSIEHLLRWALDNGYPFELTE